MKIKKPHWQFSMAPTYVSGFNYYQYHRHPFPGGRHSANGLHFGTSVKPVE
ncbi:hypothetical protein [Fulvivirga kasyanovii]|uniref:hypothetical protein n=1 Tax=Fulvivirga kasyanovii TaxID=396812 RepID=UPI0031E23B18